MKCSYCKKTIAPGKGKTLIKKDGSMLHFCSMKCEKNMLKLKRKARDRKWSSK